MSFGVLGDKETLLGFAFAGVQGTVAENAEEARRAFADFRRKAVVQILIVTEPVGDLIHDEIAEHRLSGEPPYVVEVADLMETPVERKSMEEMIYDAVGLRIRKRHSEE